MIFNINYDDHDGHGVVHSAGATQGRLTMSCTMAQLEHGYKAK